MNFLLHRKIAICMLFIALTGLGYVSYKQLPVELLPNAELPMLFVQVTSAQDMDPSYVESEVVIPIEGAIGTIGGVEQIESLIDRRQSSIKIDFKSNINFKITGRKRLTKSPLLFPKALQYRYKRSMFRCLPVASCRSRCVDRVVRTGFVT